MSTDLQTPCVSVRRSRLENYDRETADKILGVYNASKKGDLDLTDARRELTEIDPLLVGKDDWLVQRAYVGAKDVGGYPVSGRSTGELKERLSEIGGSACIELFKELIRVGSNIVDEKNAFKSLADIAPQFLDVPGITFPPPYPFSNPRVRALFEHQENETSHDLQLRRDGLYFVKDEDPIIEILKSHITGDLSKREAKKQLKDIHPGLLKEYEPPTFTHDRL